MSESTDTQPFTIDSDDGLIALWLQGRSVHTCRAYSKDVSRFRKIVRKDLRSVTRGDILAFEESLRRLSDATRARMLSSVKSLFTFAHRLDYLKFDVGAMIEVPKIPRLGEEFVLREAQVIEMIGSEESRRNRAILRTLYVCALRVSELTSLTWGALTEDGEGGRLIARGWGGRHRSVLIPRSLWKELLALRPPAIEGEDETLQRDTPVFSSRQGQALCDRQIWQITRTAALRAGITASVSPSTIRHCNVSFNIDHGRDDQMVVRFKLASADSEQEVEGIGETDGSSLTITKAGKENGRYPIEAIEYWSNQSK